MGRCLALSVDGRLGDSEGGLGSPDVGLHVKSILVLSRLLVLRRLNSSTERSTEVVAVGEGKATGRAEVLGEVITSKVSSRLGLEAKTACTVLRLAEILVDRLVIAELCVLAELTEASRHRLRTGHVGAAGASAASGQAVSRSRASTLEVVLPVHGQMLLSEVNLEVRVAVVVPVLLSANGIPDAEEESLGLEVGRVSKLDGEGEAIMTQRCFPWADFVAVVSGDLRGGLPVVQGETAGDGFVKGNVGDSHRTQQSLLVAGEPNLF